MARPLNLLDSIIIAFLVIVTAVLIYLLSPLDILLTVAAVGYLIYRWYTDRRLLHVS